MKRYVTHSGKFHLDDALAYAMLRRALGTSGHILVRSRDEGIIAAADIVWDVGGVYDPACMRYDHHQAGAPTHPDGHRYSAAGLVWRHHGSAVVGEILGDCLQAPLEAVVAAVAERFVRAVDLTDNGHATTLHSDLSRAIEAMNPDWLERRGLPPEHLDRLQSERFARAADLADSVLVQHVRAEHASTAAIELVLACHGGGSDPRILVMEEAMPWKGAVRLHGLPVLLAVYPYSSGWVVDTIEKREGDLELLLPLPQAWAGLRGAEMEKVSGVPGADFCHLGRFLAAGRTQESAMMLALRALSSADAVQTAA